MTKLCIDTVSDPQMKSESSPSGTCKAGVTYGFLGPEAYVDLGCSGEFEICYVEGRTETVTCASEDGDLTTCDFDGSCDVRSIALLETVSNEPCIEGFSFSTTSSGITVTKSCEATFTVGCRVCGAYKKK
ncbi:secreted protein [Elysia marginata]|uniref:Secreted protein n=1 Tax=Elysia marginata TaxID=1093978 RepID=A0AAV4HRD7_9GAST|nr:secreted protein [Elysia marginata]